jgi:hypothetical protein
MIIETRAESVLEINPVVARYAPNRVAWISPTMPVRRAALQPPSHFHRMGAAHRPDGSSGASGLGSFGAG